MLFLASASPRRQQLIALLGLPYRIEPSLYDEPAAPRQSVHLPSLVMHLAQEKAKEAASRCRDGIVIGADTLVGPDSETGAPMGKPSCREEAVSMLQNLSGCTHRVYTGIALLPIGSTNAPNHPRVEAVCTKVRFRMLHPDEIESYVASGEPMDKAGSYGVQGYAAPFVEHLEGDFYNVMGLPLCRLSQLLRELGAYPTQQNG